MILKYRKIENLFKRFTNIKDSSQTLPDLKKKRTSILYLISIFSRHHDHIIP